MQPVEFAVRARRPLRRRAGRQGLPVHASVRRRGLRSRLLPRRASVLPPLLHPERPHLLLHPQGATKANCKDVKYGTDIAAAAFGLVAVASPPAAIGFWYAAGASTAAAIAADICDRRPSRSGLQGDIRSNGAATSPSASGAWTHAESSPGAARDDRKLRSLWRVHDRLDPFDREGAGCRPGERRLNGPGVTARRRPSTRGPRRAPLSATTGSGATPHSAPTRRFPPFQNQPRAGPHLAAPD